MHQSSNQQPNQPQQSLAFPTPSPMTHPPVGASLMNVGPYSSQLPHGPAFSMTAQPMVNRPLPPASQNQEVRFYKSGLFGFSSAIGQFERDWKRTMQPAGWRVTAFRQMGVTVSLRRVIVVVYER